MWQFTGTHRPSFAIKTKPGEESVWDYPRPPACVPDGRKVIVRHGNQIIAETLKAIRVLETASPPTFYIPANDINLDSLVQSSGSSFCEWKGNATYWSLKTDDQQIKNVGWSYNSPSKHFAAIKNHFSFYPALLECTVNGETVRPQPGGFYGGWVTDEIVGPYKGEPGTSGW